MSLKFKLLDPRKVSRLTAAHRALCGETLRHILQQSPFGCWKAAPLRCCDWSDETMERKRWELLGKSMAASMLKW